MHIDKINSIAKKKYNNCIYIVAGAFFVGLIMFISTFLLVNTQIFFSDELYLGGKLLEYEMGNNAPDTYYGLSSFLIFLLIKTGLIRKLSLLNVLLNILKIFYMAKATTLKF